MLIFVVANQAKFSVLINMFLSHAVPATAIYINETILYKAGKHAEKWVKFKAYIDAWKVLQKDPNI